MASLTNLLTLLALAFSLLVTAAPTAVNDKSTGTFSVPIVHNIDVRRHGPSEHLRVLKKYGLTIPEKLQQVVNTHNAKKAVDAVSSGNASVLATADDGDLMWTAPVGIGSPPQLMIVDFDTGSSDTWVFSTDTDKSEVAGQTLYNPAKSSTASVIPNCTWSIMYGDFSDSSGICYKDSFALGGLSIPNMTIESAQTVSEQFSASNQSSGLVGLGWPAITQTSPPQKCLIQFLPDVLSQPIFTVDFRHNSTGSMNFGYIDKSLYQGNVSYVAVDNSEGFWTVQNSGFGIGGQDLAYSYDTPASVYVDTGSTLLFAPESAVDTYFDSVPSASFDEDQQGYVVSCDADLPDFLWVLNDNDGGEIQGSVPGPYLIYAHVNDTSCYAGLQSLDDIEGPDGIFGDMFLKSGFAVFDIDGQRFGMASKVLNTSNSKRAVDYPEAKVKLY
ncbi:secreted aspartic proteinase precursor [Xylariaceae sp. FL0804]|nr:secreted aspartic proteinase precursor [Xylariaceae sp. FL0804]